MKCYNNVYFNCFNPQDISEEINTITQMEDKKSYKIRTGHGEHNKRIQQNKIELLNK